MAQWILAFGFPLRLRVSARNQIPPQAPQNFVQRRVQLGHRSAVSGGRGQENQIATAQFIAQRMQTITFAQPPPRSIALGGLALFFRHHERRAHLFVAIAPPVRLEREQRMANALALGKGAVELGAGQTIGTGQHGKQFRKCVSA